MAFSRACALSARVQLSCLARRGRAGGRGGGGGRRGGGAGGVLVQLFGLDVPVTTQRQVPAVSSMTLTTEWWAFLLCGRDVPTVLAAQKSVEILQVPFLGLVLDVARC